MMQCPCHLFTHYIHTDIDNPVHKWINSQNIAPYLKEIIEPLKEVREQFREVTFKVNF